MPASITLLSELMLGAAVMGWPFWAQRRLRGVRLEATDAEWTVGSGAEIRGPIRGLLLLLTGRTSTALPMLSGEGLSILAPAVPRR